MIVTWNRGRKETFDGTPKEIVKMMHRSSRIRESDDQGYMQAVANRVKVFSGDDIDPSDPLAFIVCLYHIGLMTIVDASDIGNDESTAATRRIVY